MCQNLEDEGLWAQTMFIDGQRYAIDEAFTKPQQFLIGVCEMIQPWSSAEEECGDQI